MNRPHYQPFATATSRPAALCRERTSLLRIVKPRDWRSPGFDQSPNDPVVCVSHADAAAYAQWMQKQTGERYRLPRGDELQGVGPAPGKRVSDWTEANSVVGTSWRGAGSRTLDANRGYDDVGFRLVRDE